MPKDAVGISSMFFRRVLGRRNALAMGVWGTRRDPTQPILPPINALKIIVNIDQVAMRAAQGFPP